METQEEQEQDPPAEPKLTAAQKKKEEKRALRQKQLLFTIQEAPVDWRKVETFMFGENLDPNYCEPGSRVCTHHMAAYDGEAEVLRWCLREKADVNARTSLGRSVLHYACDGNKPRCIRLLLEAEADVNMRTLSQMTPLHFCCMYNSYEAVMVLLHDSKQVLDIDAENAKRQIPESLAKDRRIYRAVKKYRNNLDERRRADLLEQCLRRLFQLFDPNGDESIMPEEWAETQALIAQHFSNVGEDAIDSVFSAADKNRDGRVDWKEFKEGHEALMEALGVPFREVLNRLNDIETCIYKERLRVDEQAQEGRSISPVVSERAKEIALKREQNRSEADISLHLPKKLAWGTENEAN